MTNDRLRLDPLHLAVLVLIALIVACATWLLVARPGGDGPRNDDRATNAAASATARTSERLSPETSPADGVVLPAGGDQANGLPVNFPYTDLGAVAAQVSVSRAQIGFDYDTALTAVRNYAAPDDAAVFEQRARAAVAQRRRAAGVPAVGEAPAPASYAATPVAYTVTALDTDCYAVTLLSDITLTTTAGKTRDGFYAGTQLVEWIADDPGDSGGGDSGGDWKLVEGSQADIQQVLDAGRPRPAAPGTPAFEVEGWIRLNARLP